MSFECVFEQVPIEWAVRFRSLYRHNDYSKLCIVFFSCNFFLFRLFSATNWELSLIRFIVQFLFLFFDSDFIWLLCNLFSRKFSSLFKSKLYYFSCFFSLVFSFAVFVWCFCECMSRFIGRLQLEYSDDDCFSINISDICICKAQTNSIPHNTQTTNTEQWKSFDSRNSLLNFTWKKK